MPGSTDAERNAIAPNPTPPAAPAPGCSVMPIAQVTAHDLAEPRQALLQGRVRRPGPRPSAGRRTAPRRPSPSSRLSTSLATATVTFFSRPATPVTSIGVQVAQRGAARGQLVAVGVEEARAERGGHAGAAVGAGAAAEAEHDLLRPARTAAAISSPVPTLEAVSGANRPPGSRFSPDASASSTTATPSRTA